MLAPHSARPRSHSSPAHPSRSASKAEVPPAPAQHSAFAAVEEVPDLRGNGNSPQSSPRAASHNPRQVFRLKRPSSSSSAMDPTFSSDLHASSSSPPQNRLPPLPPVPPRRDTGSGPRPSTSSGPRLPEYTQKRVRRASTSASDLRRESSFFRGFGPIMEAGTDFVLQRKKSRSNRQLPSKTSTTTPKVQEEVPVPGPQFSTPDRAILQELKRKMQARDAQFRIKNGKKHHPYSPNVVPYPASCERDVVDNDIWECMWAQDVLNGQITWYVPDRPPGKVFGQDSGYWIPRFDGRTLTSSVSGLDIVPLQPDLYQTGSSQLASRITWVQANFLEGLPFPNEEFDFVHAKRISRGVPEDEWDSLLEDIHRILKPDGVFSLSDEELVFPGNLANNGRSPDAVDLTKSIPSTGPATPEDSPGHSSRNSPMSDVVFSPDPNSDSDELSAPRRAQSDPRWLKALEVSAFPSTLSLGLMSPTAAPISPAVSTSPTRTRATPAGSPKRERSEQELLDVVTLGKPEPKPAFDPRDHRLLEYIYNEMHALRFINLEPIAVITNAMSLIFREVVTHPPVILAFPPVSTNPATCAGATKGKQDEHGSATSDLSTHADEHSPLISFAQVAAGGSPYVRFDYDRVTRRHPRGVMIIGSDSDSTSEKNSSLPSRPSAPLPPVHELVPLAGLTFDHRSLNMHLHLRVKEVLSCAEAMWQFVLDYQERNLDGARPRSAQGQGQGQGQGQRRGRMRLRKNREFHEDLVQLHRREFDAMLTRYRLDMEEHTLLTNSVHSRLSWPHVRSPKPPERVEFEELCEKWEKHLAETASTQTQLDHGHSNSLTSGSTFSELSITSTPASEASSEYATSQPGHAIPEGRIAASAKPFQESKDPAGCPSRTPHPSERTSRTFRTIVAWK